MIKGIGVDIIEIDRIKEAVRHHGGKFLERVYTRQEIAYCGGRKKLKYPELAVRFAAKEAYSKALGTGLKGIRLKAIEIVNNSNGKPHIALEGKVVVNVHVSLSHSQKYAVASVVIEE